MHVQAEIKACQREASQKAQHLELAIKGSCQISASTGVEVLDVPPYLIQAT
jgi:hypothetical protein